MFKWLKKKEKFHSEICIPKIMINNEIEFDYEYVVERASILINESEVKARIANLVENSITNFEDEVITPDPGKDVIKVYSMNAVENDDKLIMAVVSEPSKSSEPYLLAHKFIKADAKAGSLRKLKTASSVY